VERLDAPDRFEVVLGETEQGELLAGAAMTAEATGVFWEAFASVFARRMPISAALTAGSSPVGWSGPAATGHDAECTEPSCVHDHTSSVANGRNGASSRSMMSIAERRAMAADAWAAGSPAP
jgi:hypothetical protein